MSCQPRFETIVPDAGRALASPIRSVLPAILGALLFFLASAAAPADAVSQEYEVKASLLVRFAQFVEWPAAAFANPDAPISIGILGDDHFGNFLDDAIQGESVRNRKFVIKRSKKLEELKTCQILFISKSEKDQIPQILEALNGVPVLTVGETEDFASRAGIVNFYIDNNKVRFEINADAAQRKGIKISSQLLKRAKVIGSNSR